MGDSCEFPNHDIRNLVMERIIREMHLPVSCQHHALGCGFKSVLKEVVEHENRCRYREIHCQVLNCYADIRFHELEDHLGDSHGEMEDGQWHITKLMRAPAEKGI